MKRKAFILSWLRFCLEVLAWEAVVLGLVWLLHRYWIPFRRVNISDELFIVGVLVCLLGSAGMMRNPYYVAGIPGGVPAFPVQASEEEKRLQILADFMQQRSFAMHSLAAGLLTILLSVGIWKFVW